MHRRLLLLPVVIGALLGSAASRTHVHSCRVRIRTPAARAEAAKAAAALRDGHRRQDRDPAGRLDREGGEGSGAQPAVCGNGELEPGELCDDGGVEDGNAAARLARWWRTGSCAWCRRACIERQVCGKRPAQGEEACDDGNARAGDGCAADCLEVEAGWLCPRPDVPCVELRSAATAPSSSVRSATTVASLRDGAAAPKTRCSTAACLRRASTARCTGRPARALECGDGNRTPGEACDDGNAVVEDGCDGPAASRRAGAAPRAAATTICGDGVLLGEEACRRRQPAARRTVALQHCRLWSPSGPCEGEPSVSASTIVCRGREVGRRACDPRGRTAACPAATASPPTTPGRRVRQ
jgi:cysteine-rich repeat protein